ncbi:unnamed protein product [Linum trigynum]|uniref:Uncharacterized protein n=1 Tax=Linum trigynum TaxID=586398 RepID=A0AAV2DU99_9ROSI
MGRLVVRMATCTVGGVVVGRSEDEEGRWRKQIHGGRELGRKRRRRREIGDVIGALLMRLGFLHVLDFFFFVLNRSLDWVEGGKVESGARD